jgi:hypothetical protein
MFKVLVFVLLRTGPELFKNYEKFTDGELYIVNSQMCEEK